jgi:hypothetical protein
MVPLHVRLPAETVERVRERQDIADEALREWLSSRNF